MSKTANESAPNENHGGIYEEIPFGVWMCDADGGLRYASDSFLELLGMSMEEASGDGWTKRIASDDTQSVERWKECVELEYDWDNEHRIRDQQGEIRTLIARGHAVRDDSGGVTHWIGVHLDITKRKQAEERVKDACNFAEALIETVPEPLIVLDHEHRVVTANPAFYRRFESEKETTEGRLLHDLGNGQWDIPALHTLLSEVLKENDSFDDYEVEHDFPDIGRKVMLVTGRRVPQRVNHTEMVLLAIRDITEARQREDRLRISHETQAVRQERDRLAKRLHDHLQQLLIGANMQIGMLQRSEAEEDKLDSLGKVRRILDEAINASRDLAVELTPPVLEDSGLMAALEWLAAWVSDMHQLGVDIQVQQDVSLEDQNICLLLFDVVRELLLNVVKHAQVESATVRAESYDDLLEITVIDRGAGYVPSETEGKFDPAVGFGLSGVRRRIEAVGGNMEVVTGRGQGTKTTIRVPLRQEQPIGVTE